MKSLKKSILFLGLIFVAQNAMADLTPGVKPTLNCSIDESREVLLETATGSVSLGYKANLTSEVAYHKLDMNFFKDLRCPLCYEFLGHFEGDAISGRTRGNYDLNRDDWVVVLDLVLDTQVYRGLECKIQ